MDVIVVVNSVTGALHFTEFYVKFKSPLIESTSAAILGLSLEGLAQQSNYAFQNQDNGEVSQTAERDYSAQNPPPEPDWVDIICNNERCEGVIAFIGVGKLLHFYDPVTQNYSVSPSDQMLMAFNLNFGKNHVVCWHRGTGIAREFNIWKLNCTDRLVIMDIDGTVTKSDITGYIQTVYLGMFSYVHEGVVSFLNVLKDSYNYTIVYLSSRPMIHRKETKQLLERIKDEYGLSMPDGPLFTNKERILLALYREISKNTVEFKSQVLADIAEVFRVAGCPHLSPYILGIGNKEADAVAYNSVGVPAERILLIDPSSQIFVWKYTQLIRKHSNSGWIETTMPRLGRNNSRISFRDNSSNEDDTVEDDFNQEISTLEGVNDVYSVKFNTYKDENLLRYITRVATDQRSTA